ncbi:XRE family transcriptional regulator [Saxibacter everestensis]|uniref:XRE family transcriptional regulator n=1 Tax=Saxibacter everestensis TaxID=2909229 RepID=A0ABY8QRB5_9MICO|nr:XRE family transcriptional regulator [Brevibacteriaceae bacterium ZFBP1038]
MTDISRRLRSTRLNRGLTQSELALKAGLSPSFISQFERGQSDASMSSLSRICTALGITFGDLFRSEQVLPNLIRRRDRRRIDLKQAGSKYVISRPGMAGVDVCCIEFNVGGSTGEAYSHLGKSELVICINGVVGVELDGELQLLNRGDSVDFQSTVSHRISNQGSASAEFYWITQELDLSGRNGAPS